MQDKYLEEIEEILKNAGETAPGESRSESEIPLEDRPRSVSRATEAEKPTSSYSPKGRRWPTVTPGKLLLTGLVVFVVTAIL